jgi:phosphatidylserine/phosphatidylglycerophosphate/cardiolipin synthase-like enzyme
MPTFDSSIPTHNGCSITPLINGPDYFNALRRKIEALGSGDVSGQFIYLMGWLLDPDFAYPDGVKIVDLLKARARAGVDVRLLGWVLAPEVMQNSRVQSAPQLRSMLRLNSLTMLFINRLRAEPNLANRACVNILAHPAGAVHMKGAIIGSNSGATGYTGGLDLESFRWNPDWHDIQAEIGGPIVQSLFDAFRQMWNEVRGRPVARLTTPFGVTCDSHTSSMPDLPARTLAVSSAGTMRAQSVRTVPQMRFASAGSLASLGGVSIPTNRPLSFAPNGLFEIRKAWECGISGARQYIYIEDQGFSSREVFDWINAAVKANSGLRVVILGGQADPTDQTTSRPEKYFRIAVNQHLLAGLSGAQINQIGVFSHQRKVIHSKTTIVDDAWAILGSANSMRRSLYTDFEHSIAYMDGDSREIDGYRMDLWGVHLQQSIPDAADGLDAWFAIPFRGAGAPSHLNIVRLRLPLPNATLTSEEQTIYEEVEDADSRQPCGDQLVYLFTRQFVGGLFGS